MQLTRRKILIGAAIVVSLVVVLLSLPQVRTALPLQLPFGQHSLQSYADSIIATCASSSYHPACYDKEIPKLMDKGLSMEDSFKVTALIQNKVHDYYFCHVLGHELAEKETAKDPSKWTEVIARCPVGQCSNGCLHGAAQERFRNESLTPSQIAEAEPQLAGTCQPVVGRNYTGLEQASCYHALGHLAMYITAGKVPDATKVCDVIAKHGREDFTETCYEGVYMQIFQPLEPEDFGLVRAFAPTTTAAAETYCNMFSGIQGGACHRESWPLYRSTLNTPDGLMHFCSLTPNESGRCYNAMFYVLTAMFNFDTTKIETLCDGLPTDIKGQCYANAASRAIETDYRLAPTSVALCKRAEAGGVGDRCYKELLFYSTFNYHVGSPEFTAFCKQLPGDWATQCLSGKTTQPPSAQQAPIPYTHD
jgi:hypothetical protein